MTAIICALASAGATFGEENDPSLSLNRMKQMSLEQLMDIEVISVSKVPEKISEAPSAIQVITQEDIRRSGATSLPEALRLASNLQVAQLDGHEWAISARGFNSTSANKLLVMIDGRTVYTPLYSGVFWDAQQVLLEDVDRIEVVSGPGGTLWGSNAVNGVINIVTKEAANTQGLYLAGITGTLDHGTAVGRVGGKQGDDVFYRVYARHIDRNGLVFADGSDAGDGFTVDESGFRIDWRRSSADQLTLQGDLYASDINGAGPAETDLTGQNVIGRWSHAFSPESDLQLQVYFDRTWRKPIFTPTVAFTDDLRTYDFDFHHRFQLGARHNVLWGLGYRLMQDRADNFPIFSFLPAHKDLNRFNAFVQDEVALLQRLKLTVGSKLEHEEYSGFNLQPSARIAWSPDDRQTVWGAISRAVRTPSRIDVEFFAPTPPVAPGTPHYEGGPDFGSETLIAYELGYRVQPLQRLSLSLATFYNRYDDLRSLEISNLPTLALQFRNGLQGDARGAELSGDLQIASWWKLRGGYTYLESDIRQKDGHVDLTTPHGQWNDPAHQANVQSMTDLPYGFEVNVSGYYVSHLSLPFVQPRLNYSAGLVWRHGGFEASVYGYNLADDQDPEFVVQQKPEEIPRSVYGKVACRF